MKLLTNTAYNMLILPQEYPVYFRIVKEAKTNEIRYPDSIQVGMTLAIKFEPTTETYKTRIHKFFVKCELYETK